MALPRKLKNFNVFNDGNSYLGEATKVALPKIAMSGEDYRGAGMLGPVSIDQGLEKLEMEHTYGGMVVGIMRQMGAARVDATLLRFRGAYQSDSNAAVSAAELVVRGRHAELDPGDAEAGKDTEWKVKTALSYLKWAVDGVVEVEIDLVTGLYVVGGVDRTAEIRAAIGISSNPLSGLISGPSLNIPSIPGFSIG
jgi:hypothetical protein